MGNLARGVASGASRVQVRPPRLKMCFRRGVQGARRRRVAESARVSADAPEATPRADSRTRTRAKIASAGPIFESPWSGPSCRCRARRFRNRPSRRNPRLRIRPSLRNLRRRRRFRRRRRHPSAPVPSSLLYLSLSPSARRAGLASSPAPPPPPLEQPPPTRPHTRITSSPTPTGRRWVASPPREPRRWRPTTPREVAPPRRPSIP